MTYEEILENIKNRDKIDMEKILEHKNKQMTQSI